MSNSIPNTKPFEFIVYKTCSILCDNNAWESLGHKLLFKKANNGFKSHT